jgi:hypothetical protein
VTAAGIINYQRQRGELLSNFDQNEQKETNGPLLKAGFDKLGLLEFGFLIVHNGPQVASSEARDVPAAGATSSGEDSPLYPLTVSPISATLRAVPKPVLQKLSAGRQTFGSKR